MKYNVFNNNANSVQSKVCFVFAVVNYLCSPREQPVFPALVSLTGYNLADLLGNRSSHQWAQKVMSVGCDW